MEKQDISMEQLLDAVNRASEHVQKLFADKKQFHRHLVNAGKENMEERVLHKVDTKALKEAMSVLKELSELMAELGVREEQEGVKVVFEAGEDCWND